MNLQFLRYFAVLAEELHFGRAADRLAITQPPLSSAIKALEEELGVRLFVRDSKQVRLTPAGAAFLTDVQVILERRPRQGNGKGRRQWLARTPGYWRDRLSHLP